MKKISILSFLLIGMFAACKKSNSGQPTYHVSGSVDGSAKTYNYLSSATRASNGSMNAIMIQGAADATGTAVITLNVTNSTGPVTTGTYIDSVSSPTLIDVDYMVPSLNQIYNGGSSAYVNATKTIANHTKVVISYIDSVSVKGTFSGDVFLSGDASAAKKTITNGDFNVKFK